MKPRVRAVISGAVLLVAAACGEESSGSGATESRRSAPAEPSPRPAPAPGPAPPDVEAEVGRRVTPSTTECERHRDCRVLPGVCGHPTACNQRSIETVRRQIEAYARVTSCGVPGFAFDETTPACVDGACRALHGTVEEHRCRVDSDCVVVEGLCGPTEVVRAEARIAFAARVEALRQRGLHCGYGVTPERVRAICDDGLCTPGVSEDRRR